MADLQIALNLRALTWLLALGFSALKDAGQEHGRCLSSRSRRWGIGRQPDVVRYEMTKAIQGIYCQGPHLEYARHGVQSTVLYPACVATPGAAWSTVDTNLPVTDVGEAVRFLLSTSRACFIPEVRLAPQVARPRHVGASVWP